MNSSSYGPTIQAVHRSPRSVPHFKRLATEGKPWRRRSLQIVARRCCRGLGLAVLDVAATRCRRAQRCHRQISLISTPSPSDLGSPTVSSSSPMLLHHRLCPRSSTCTSVHPCPCRCTPKALCFYLADTPSFTCSCTPPSSSSPRCTVGTT